MLVFVDTGAWVALALRKDRRHLEASRHFQELLAERVGLVTSNYVLSETLTRVRYDGGHQAAVMVSQIVDEAQERKRLSVKWVGPEIETEAMDIFVRYSDQAFSVTDCTSFVICKELRISRVFSFDKDFSVMGFEVEPRIEN